jgi:hypothetical protein
MITTISPLRRAAVTLVLTGATALGAVAIAPAAVADDTAVVIDQAPVTEQAPVTDAAPQDAPVAPDVVVPDVPAPAAEAPAPAPAPVVAPPAVVIGKDGKPVKAPKVCTDKDQKEFDAKIAKATQQGAPLMKAAGQLRDASAALRAQAAKLTSVQSQRVMQALATVSDMAASKLEAQAQALITKVGGIGCITVTAPGGRF